MHEEVKELRKEIRDINDRKRKVEVLRKRSMWRRTIGYPLIMVLITALTAASLISVVKNVGQIVAGFKSLPAANQVNYLHITTVFCLCLLIRISTYSSLW